MRVHFYEPFKNPKLPSRLALTALAAGERLIRSVRNPTSYSLSLKTK